MAKTVDKLFEKYLDKFEKEFLRAINTGDEEAIHDLRVSIKKIRALFLFLKEAGFADIKSDYKYLGKLKEVFKKAGKLREFHIHKDLLEHYRQRTGENFPVLAEYIEAQEKEARQAWHDFMPGLKLRKLYHTADQLHKAIDGIPAKKLNSRLHDFVKSRVDECHGFMFEPHYENHLHQIRKYLKHIRFIIGQKIGNIHEQFENEIDFRDTKKVEDILGEWHDRDEFRKLLEEFYSQLEETRQEEISDTYRTYKDQVEKDIREDVQKLRPELLQVFSVMQTLLERQS
ncbi:MAG: CHAD domain-containing protein [Bacteroidales bacterium]|nr:CHAD domain-containing protein [Bacteroidales bacterium]